MDRGAWLAVDHGVAESQTQMSKWALTQIRQNTGEGVGIWRTHSLNDFIWLGMWRGRICDFPIVWQNFLFSFAWASKMIACESPESGIWATPEMTMPSIRWNTESKVFITFGLRSLSLSKSKTARAFGYLDFLVSFEKLTLFREQLGCVSGLQQKPKYHPSRKKTFLNIGIVYFSIVPWPGLEPHALSCEIVVS